MARRNRKPIRGDEAPGWVWMLFGLALGLVVAFGVYVSGTRAPSQQVAEPTIQAVPTAEQPAPVEPEQMRFDFYEFLPQFKVVVPQSDTRTADSLQTAPVEEPGTYLVQAGSFTTPEDAERHRATLGLLIGIETHMQQALVGGQTVYRVMIGPFTDLDELNSVRRRLLDARVDSMTLQARP